jgi:hypothetical protein
VRREYWLVLAASGAAMALLPGWPAFALLLFVPGFSLTSLLKEKLTLVELLALPATFSILLLPLATLLLSPFTVRATAFALGSFAIAVGIYQYWKKADLHIERSDLTPALIAGLIFFVVLVVSLRTFFYSGGALFHGFTHGMDLNFHLSIAQRYVTVPHIPPEDPYLPGHYLPYNWFMHLLFGEVSLLCGLDVLAVFKALVSVASALIFLDAYLLARLVCNDDVKASLAGALLFVLSSGLSWLYVIYKYSDITRLNLFKYLVYEFPGIMKLKYDPTSLYFFLPQPQLFGLLVMVFALYLFAMAVKKRSVLWSIATGIALSSLVFYHLINAFPVFAGIALFMLYAIYRYRNVRTALILVLPLAMGAITIVYQLAIMPASGETQIVLGHHKDVLLTSLLSLGPLVPFALYGMYESRKSDGAKLLIAFTAVNLASLNLFLMESTGNTYRFLTYLTLPVSLFSGLVFSRWLASPKIGRFAVALAVILLMLPSTFLIVDYYANNQLVSFDTPADVKAIGWIKENTPMDAIIYEKPSYFVSIPLLSGRGVAYAGKAYTRQYHGVFLQNESGRIMNETDPEAIRSGLMQFNASYVFLGTRERDYPFASALNDTRYFHNVYDADGVRIYKVENDKN